MIASRRALIVVVAFVLMAIGLPWGGNVPAAFAQIQVLSANPNTGDQGTLGLNVTIGGKGFKKGAKAYFYLKGTENPAGITVRATKFVSDASLVATIDIAAGATPDSFDIVVAADGRTGKGTELFTVAVKIDPCTVIPAATGGYFSVPPGLPGSLDTSFGNGAGKAIGPRFMQVGYFGGQKATAIQEVDGEARIVAAGRWRDTCGPSSADSYWAIARYRSDGSLDRTFGDLDSSGNPTGVVVTSEFSVYAYSSPVSVVVQPPDPNALVPETKIVVFGSAAPTRKSTGRPLAIRFNQDGSLDTTFGVGGLAWVSTPGTIYSVAVQGDRKIVAAGTPGLVLRLDPDGGLDPSFNGTGVYLGPLSLYPDLKFQAVTTQSVEAGERIVVAGNYHDSFHDWVSSVWRFMAAGTLDTSFGDSDSGGNRTGVVKTWIHTEDGLYHEDLFRDLAIDSSNRIVAGGYVLTEFPDFLFESQLFLARYELDGSLDPSFGLAGLVRAPSGQFYGIGNALAIQPDGKILLAGRTEDENRLNERADLWRFNVDGSFDATFGQGGRVSDPIAADADTAQWSGIVLYPEGKIVCVGYIGYLSKLYGVVGRYWQ
jgi:uncharacterized delta-60 repeat protein